MGYFDWRQQTLKVLLLSWWNTLVLSKWDNTNAFLHLKGWNTTAARGQKWRWKIKILPATIMPDLLVVKVPRWGWNAIFFRHSNLAAPWAPIISGISYESPYKLKYIIKSVTAILRSIIFTQSIKSIIWLACIRERPWLYGHYKNSITFSGFWMKWTLFKRVWCSTAIPMSTINLTMMKSFKWGTE